MKYFSSILVLVAVWTLLVAPSTCGGGLLAHACASDFGTDRHHENDCPSDPCNAANEVTTVAKTVVKSVLTAAPPAPTGTSMIAVTASSAVPQDLHLRVLPLPADALPLVC